MEWYNQVLGSDKNETNQFLIDVIYKYAPHLLEYTDCNILTKTQIRNIILEILKAGSWQTVKYLHDTFKRLVKYAVTHLNFQSAPIPKFAISRHDAARYTPRTAYYRLQSQILEQIFWASIESMDKLNERESYAQFILSSILYGGLLDKKMVIRLHDTSLNTVQCFRGIAWVDLNDDKNENTNNVQRRWFIDPVSKQLLKRFRYQFKKNNDKLVSLSEDQFWKNIKQLYRKFSPENSNQPVNLSNLIEWVKAGINIALPPYVVDFASGRNPSCSLNQTCFERIFTGCTLNVNNAINTLGITESKIAFNKDKDDWYTQNYHISSINVLEEIELGYQINKSSERYMEECTSQHPTLTAIVKWPCAIICGQKKHSNWKYLLKYHSVSKKLIMFSQSLDITKFSLYEFIDLYQDILTSCSSLTDAINTGKQLEQFHRYLVKSINAPALKFIELDGFIPANYSVSANIISLHEYKILLSRLWPTHSLDDRINAILNYFSVLGYRLGLRSQELIRLRISDIRFTRTLCEMRIMTTDLGSPKSISGKRNIPVHDLLSDAELDDLRKWYNLRLSESKTDDELLFCMSDTPHIPLTRYYTFDVIIRELQNLVGDTNIRFHSLRHSFATMMLLSYEANRLPDLFDPRIELFHPDHSPLAANFHTLLDGRIPTRKLLYQLAMLMGQSSPDITLSNYVHSLDWILYHWQLKRIPRLTIKQLAPLLGYKIKRCYERVKSAGITVVDSTYNLLEAIHLTRPSLRDMIG